MLDKTSETTALGHRILMVVLFSITVAATILIAVQGWDYYVADRLERPHMELHPNWKAGGPIGHGLGIVGSTLMILMMLYIPRKRMRALQNIGKLRHWLNIHIWMGVTAPILITFHSTFKFGGIISVAYWSMVAVALSGVLGRYIYVQIPRTVGGEELSESDLDEMDRSLRDQMRSVEGVHDELELEITRELTQSARRASKGLAAVFAWIAQDITRPIRVRRLKRRLRRDTSLSRDDIRSLIHYGRRRALLIRRRGFLNVARKTLHHWHVIHRPFALIMFIIMFIHIGVAVLFGYTWIF